MTTLIAEQQGKAEQAAATCRERLKALEEERRDHALSVQLGERGAAQRLVAVEEAIAVQERELSRALAAADAVARRQEAERRDQAERALPAALARHADAARRRAAVARALDEAIAQVCGAVIAWEAVAGDEGRALAEVEALHLAAERRVEREDTRLLVAGGAAVERGPVPLTGRRVTSKVLADRILWACGWRADSLDAVARPDFHPRWPAGHGARIVAVARALLKGKGG